MSEWMGMDISQVPSYCRICRVPNPASFTRNSIAFAEEPSYKKVTNLLGENESTGGDTTQNPLPGFGASVRPWGGSIHSPEYITTDKHQGNGCISVTTYGEVVSEGFVIYLLDSVQAGVTYTLSYWVKIPLGTVMTPSMWRGAHTDYPEITGTGDWQKIVLTYTTPSTGAMNTKLNTNNIESIEIRVDTVQLEIGTVANNWTLGGTSYLIPQPILVEKGTNRPRYHPDGGIILEDWTVNVLTADQSRFVGGWTFSTDGNGTMSYLNEIGTMTYGTGTYSFIRRQNTLTVNAGDVYTFQVVFLNDTVGQVSLRIVLPGAGTVGGRTKIQVFNLDGSGVPFKASITHTAPEAGTYISADICVGTFSEYGQTTPANTVRMCRAQVEKKMFPMNWQIGGTERAGELFTIDKSCFNKYEGTFEVEIKTPPAFTQGYNGVLTIEKNNDNRCLILLRPNTPVAQIAYLHFFETTNDGAVHKNYYDNTVQFQTNTNYKIGFTYSNSGRALYINGVLKGTTDATHALFDDKGAIIGSWGGGARLNGNIKNIVFSNIKRTDSDMASRAQSSLPMVDEYVTCCMPGLKDMDLYRVVPR